MIWVTYMITPNNFSKIKIKLTTIFKLAQEGSKMIFQILWMKWTPRYMLRKKWVGRNCKKKIWVKKFLLKRISAMKKIKKMISKKEKRNLKKIQTKNKKVHQTQIMIFWVKNRKTLVNKCKHLHLKKIRKMKINWIKYFKNFRNLIIKRKWRMMIQIWKKHSLLEFKKKYMINFCNKEFFCRNH
jgi:hypothetical protein